MGPVPLRVGLEESLNLMTARVGSAVGLDTVGEYRQALRHHRPHAARIFDADRRRGDDAAAAHRPPMRCSSMAASGSRRPSSTACRTATARPSTAPTTRPCDGCSDVDWNGQAPPELPDTREQIADPRSAYQIVSMMEGVIQRGTGRIDRRRRQAARRQDRHDQRHRTTPGSWASRPTSSCGVFVGFDQPHTPRRARDRRHGRGAGLPRFHGRRAQGPAGDPVPHPARASSLVRVNADDRPARAAPATRTVIYEAVQARHRADRRRIAGDGASDGGDAVAAAAA